MNTRVKVCCRGGRNADPIECSLENIMLVDFRSAGANPMLLQLAEEKAQKTGSVTLIAVDSVESIVITKEEESNGLE